jgi:glycosyltransferase involved in cell wall biosynthesis
MINQKERLYNMPIVSVIIPIYNTEKYLSKCVNSVLSQTLKDIEIICVNDCSADKSLEVLKKFNDDRIKIINLPENRGIGTARNTAISISKGKYIYFIDSDDWIDDNYLEEMVNNIKDRNIVINANYVLEYENQEKKEYSSFNFIDGNKEYSAKTIQRFFPPVVWARLYKTSYIKENNFIFPQVKGGAEDIFYSAATELPLNNVYIYKGSYYHYTQRETSAMKQLSRGFYYIESYKMLYDFLLKNNIDTDGTKLFCGESLILDTKEKYDYTKNYLLTIESIVNSNKEIYNEYELFLFDIMKNTTDYNDFLAKYNPNISISFLRNKMRKNVCRI